MNLSFNLQMTGVEKDSHALEEKQKKILWTAMNKIEEIAKNKCPVDTGRLRSSIGLHPSFYGVKEYLLTDGVSYGIDVEYGCFFGNSRVVKILTKRGYKALRNVLIGDQVLTHKDRWRKVIDKPEYNVNKSIPRYTFKTVSGKKITVTEEHPFRVKGELGYLWKKAKDIKKGDILIGVD